MPPEARVVIKRCTADKELGKRAGDRGPWRRASDKETRNRLPDHPVVLLAMESADLRSKHKRVRFATARLTYLVCRSTLPVCLPACLPHVPMAMNRPGFNMKSVPDPGSCTRVIPVLPCYSCRSTTAESARIATDLSPDAILTILFHATRGFPNASVRDRSVREFVKSYALLTSLFLFLC